MSNACSSQSFKSLIVPIQLKTLKLTLSVLSTGLYFSIHQLFMAGESDRRHLIIDVLSPTEFLQEWATTHELQMKYGRTAMEVFCARQALEARDQYKKKRSELEEIAKLQYPPFPEYSQLPDAAKYTIRLHNNRKSAQAAKVYQEVFRMELSSLLEKYEKSIQCVLEVNGDGQQDQTGMLKNVSCVLSRELELESQIASIRSELASLKNQLTVAQQQNEILKEENIRLNAEKGIALTAREYSTRGLSSIRSPMYAAGGPSQVQLPYSNDAARPGEPSIIEGVPHMVSMDLIDREMNTVHRQGQTERNVAPESQ